MANGRVLVIGAGLAGLACAEALRRADVDVIVLEARNRIGGRVWTLHDLADGFPVEGGAMMIHGRHPSVFRWIDALHLTARPIGGFRRGRIFYRGKLRNVSSLMFAGPRHLLAAIQALWFLPRALNRYDGPDMTLADYLGERRVTALARDFVSLMYGGVNATDADRLSVRGLAEESNEASSGVPWQNFQVLDGLDRIPSGVATPIKDTIRLNTRVDRIVWSPEGARVHATGPTGQETFEGRAAVVTLPLGVLKADDVAFEPPLPESKRRAIASIGYGDVVKLLLRFDDATRTTALGRYRFLANEDGGFYFLPLSDREGAPVVLEGFIAGKKARGYAGRPDDEVVRDAVSDLATMVSIPDLAERLTASRVVDWITDPYSKGAYTYPAVGGGLDARKELAEPLDDVLFFAGEATHYGGEYATIHGTLSTGERAAEEVLAARSRTWGKG